MRNSFIESSAYVQGTVNNEANRSESSVKSGTVDGSGTFQKRMSQFLKDSPSNSKIQRDSLNRSVYRQPDGSYNNLLLPDLGRADTPYARTGKPQGIQNVALPDPGDVFDMLFARSEKKSHPNKLSSLFFSMAAVISHDLFQTNPHNPEYSQTSHYADLSPLYGNNWEEQKQMRTYLDGRLKPDCFASKRILSLHPSAGILLIMFNRFHNYVTSQLQIINENGRFTKPDSDASAEAWQKYDEDLFQTARLIVCAYYVNVIIYDYMRTILGWDKTGASFNIDPRDTKEPEIIADRKSTNGNLVSVEFNLAYRWHGGISAASETWIEEHYKTLFGKEARDIETDELVRGLQSLENELELDPCHREFAGLVRDHYGSYNDDTLVSIVTAAIEDVANSLGPNTVPKAMRAVEIQGIIQARKWNVCTLNEFRECLQLKKYTNFEEINPDRRVARKLKALYGYPDLVELYPGLVAERLKSQQELGQGLYCGSTTSAALLSNTIALIRGDRFCTADYTPSNLTNWGYAFSKGDSTVNQGHILYKLFLTAFPHHFEHNSIYAHFPFIIPSEKRDNLLQLGKEEYYNYNRPCMRPNAIIITGYWSASDLLSDSKSFRSPLGYLPLKIQAKDEQSPPEGGDSTSIPALLISHALYDESLSQERVSRFVQETAQNLILQNSVQIMKEKQIDIVRNVTNITVTQFVSDLFSIPRSPYSLKELHRILAMAFFNSPYGAPEMFEASTALPLLGEIASSLIAQVKEVSKPRSMMMFQKGNKSKPEDLHSLRSQGRELIRVCLNNNMNENDIVWKQILPAAAGVVTEVSTAIALVLEYYLNEGEEYLQRISKAATVETAQSDEVLFRYILEALRINGRLPVMRTTTTAGLIRDGEIEHMIEQGNTIVIDTVSASMGPEMFPEPTEVRLDRPMDTYLHFTENWFSGSIVSARTVQTIMISLFRTVMKLNELKPARGVQGKLKKLVSQYGYYEYLTPDWSIKSHFPTTFTVRYMTKAEFNHNA
ncbi:putative fatty acid oxygenase PpoA [Xylogone sp. PMI_703]|nr:putative fatty acid oxygenase PpoA [Xylogone sp. PMI_703]